MTMSTILKAKQFMASYILDSKTCSDSQCNTLRVVCQHPVRRSALEGGCFPGQGFHIHLSRTPQFFRRKKGRSRRTLAPLFGRR
jgi:hypothetical protein